ncbi:P-II family nitrogen regulator [Maritalea mediterranea]|uniref:Nitrogen regulatory protein P-II n=1 Tax=Maritalea mediterranea TaxID=2909667 RepID=A0ABS9E9R1_9HYPH|nr:P-II family nitrogen regulator [Maritalea mediterranea]MCF4099619.1 P-II family nitrogen regulator [Maritalea mediterranea]
MKYIIAMIKPHKLEEVREAMGALDIHGMTVTEVRGYGRQRGHTEIYRGAEYEISYVPKLKLEIAVAADKVEPAMEAIRNAATEGKIGDGKIFVLDLEQAVRVRTGETGDEAL